MADQSIITIDVPGAQQAIDSLADTIPVYKSMPAHVTLAYPFLPDERIDADVLIGLYDLCRQMPAFEVRLEAAASFSRRLLYLRPEPSDSFDYLAWAINQYFSLPGDYLAKFEPHITVAKRLDEIQLEVGRKAVERLMPITTRLDNASLYFLRAHQWHPAATFPLTRYSPG